MRILAHFATVARVSAVVIAILAFPFVFAASEAARHARSAGRTLGAWAAG